jgi:anti-sigma regulatory factor (Ser/Thr protein kinase)
MEVAVRCGAVAILDSSSVGAARRMAIRICQELGASETKTGELAIVATEAARNVLSHAGGGQLLVTGAAQESGGFLDLVAFDKGPGIANLAKAMDDGFSTAGTPGNGLGAIKRLSAIMDLHSNQTGTTLFARIDLNGRNRLGIDCSGFAIPIAGETQCGDAYTFSSSPDKTRILLIDGLGHGNDAADAASEAVLAFHRHIGEEIAEVLQYIHDNLKKTRGGVGAIAQIEPLAGTLSFVGVGNISGAVFTGDSARSLVSSNGLLGSTFPKLKVFQYEWQSDSCLIMHSDGLQTRWDLSRYPGLRGKCPATIAGILLRDFRRVADDSSIVVAKNASL